MVYAKDMNQVATQEITRRAEEKQKAHDEKIRKLTEQTREFCHSTLSRMIEEKAHDGYKLVVIYITVPDEDGICSIVEQTGPYTIEYKETIIVDKMKEILEEHDYDFQAWKYNYCVHKGKYGYQDRWVDGMRFVIEW